MGIMKMNVVKGVFLIVLSLLTVNENHANSHISYDWTRHGITTQLLVTLFNVKGVIHYGIAGNANPSLNIGDVAIPRYWSHSALWNWQRYGHGPENELALEAGGDYTREIGYIKFANYSIKKSDNILNNVWYQPEEIFPIDGTPEERQHVFWVPVDSHYFTLAKKLEDVTLEKCLNATLWLFHSSRRHQFRGGGG